MLFCPQVDKNAFCDVTSHCLILSPFNEIADSRKIDRDNRNLAQPIFPSKFSVWFRADTLHGGDKNVQKQLNQTSKPIGTIFFPTVSTDEENHEKEKQTSRISSRRDRHRTSTFRRRSFDISPTAPARIYVT